MELTSRDGSHGLDVIAPRTSRELACSFSMSWATSCPSPLEGHGVGASCHVEEAQVHHPRASTEAVVVPSPAESFVRLATWGPRGQKARGQKARRQAAGESGRGTERTRAWHHKPEDPAPSVKPPPLSVPCGAKHQICPTISESGPSTQPDASMGRGAVSEGRLQRSLPSLTAWVDWQRALTDEGGPASPWGSGARWHGQWSRRR